VRSPETIIAAIFRIFFLVTICALIAKLAQSIIAP